MTTPSSPQLSFSTRYSLDANIFIAAWRDHYPIDLYTGFWECLQHFGQEERLLSVDRVRDEINSPNELVAWLKLHWRESFALATEPDTASVFSQMQVWVQTNDQFLPAAKHEFASKADGWLAAYAKVHGTVLVTNEVFDANAKGRVPLPNLCGQFGVAYCNTIDMLRGLGVTFNLGRPNDHHCRSGSGAGGP